MVEFQAVKEVWGTNLICLPYLTSLFLHTAHDSLPQPTYCLSLSFPSPSIVSLHEETFLPSLYKPKAATSSKSPESSRGGEQAQHPWLRKFQKTLGTAPGIFLPQELLPFWQRAGRWGFIKVGSLSYLETLPTQSHFPLSNTILE